MPHKRWALYFSQVLNVTYNATRQINPTDAGLARAVFSQQKLFFQQAGFAVKAGAFSQIKTMC
jgi:hypothetical protein